MDMAKIIGRLREGVGRSTRQGTTLRGRAIGRHSVRQRPLLAPPHATEVHCLFVGEPPARRHVLTCPTFFVCSRCYRRCLRLFISGTR